MLRICRGSIPWHLLRAVPPLLRWALPLATLPDHRPITRPGHRYPSRLGYGSSLRSSSRWATVFGGNELPATQPRTESASASLLSIPPRTHDQNNATGCRIAGCVGTAPGYPDHQSTRGQTPPGPRRAPSTASPWHSANTATSTRHKVIRQTHASRYRSRRETADDLTRQPSPHNWWHPTCQRSMSRRVLTRGMSVCMAAGRPHRRGEARPAAMIASKRGDRSRESEGRAASRSVCLWTAPGSDAVSLVATWHKLAGNHAPQCPAPSFRGAPRHDT